MNEIEKYYETLDLQPGASPEEVKQAYRELAKVWHPDRFAHDPKLIKRADEKLKEINEAYTRLKSFQTDLERSHTSWEEYKQKTSPETDNSQSNTETPPAPRPSTDISTLTEYIRFLAIWPIRAIIPIIMGIVLTWLINYMITVKSPVKLPVGLPGGNTISSIESALKALGERLLSSPMHHYTHKEEYPQTKKFGTPPKGDRSVSYFYYNKNFTTRRQPTMIVPGNQENRK
jgi:hypothetical protein